MQSRLVVVEPHTFRRSTVDKFCRHTWWPFPASVQSTHLKEISREEENPYLGYLFPFVNCERRDPILAFSFHTENPKRCPILAVFLFKQLQDKRINFGLNVWFNNCKMIWKTYQCISKFLNLAKGFHPREIRTKPRDYNTD